MRSLILSVLIGTLFTPIIQGQQLSASEKKIVDSARSRYYSLESRGFVSATCAVSFDFSTAPVLPSEDPRKIQKLLKASQFAVTVDRQGASVAFHYPAGASADERRAAESTSNLLSSLVRGVFLTWPTKGLDGPIPAFESQIKSATVTSDGYLLILNFPGDPVRIEMDKKYLVTEIVSVGGKIDEHPVYSQTPDGLVFAGNMAVDDADPSGRVVVKYELGNSIVDGFRLPTSVHLQVVPNIDTRFTFKNCAVKKGIAVRVNPPDYSKPSNE